MGADIGIKGKQVTIQLTDAQKKAIAKAIGVQWDEVTFGAPVVKRDRPKGRKATEAAPDVNIVVALGQTYTVS